MPRLDELRTFARIARTGSLAAAARELGVAAPTVTKQLQALEARLGVRLVNRTTRRLVLTELGERYQARVEQLLADLESMDLEVRQLHGTPTGTLRISAPQDFGRLFLCDIVARFAALHPELRLDLELTDRLVDVVEEGWDAVIRIARTQDSSLAIRRLGVCRLVLCATPAYLEAHGRPQSPHDLQRHECIRYTYMASPAAWSFRERGRRVSIFPGGRLHANAGWAMRALMLAHQGIALLPRFLVADDLASGAVESLLDDCLDAELTLMLLRPHREPVPAKVRAFTDFVVAGLADHPDWR